MSDSGPANKTRRNMLAAALAAGATAPGLARLNPTNSSGTIMAGRLLPQPKQLFQDANWNPLVGGRIYTYAAGSLIPKTTFQDAALIIANTNPTISNARGEALMFGSGPYRFILKDAFDNVIYDVDNVESARSIADSSIAALLGSLANFGGSSLMGWIQSGTGTFLRTVQDKLRDVKNVKDYGLKMDGATDDAPAFNAMNQAFKNAGKKVVVRMSGRGKFNSGITLTTSFLKVICENAVLDFSGMATGTAGAYTTAITVAGSGEGHPYTQTDGGFGGAEIIGPGRETYTTGMLFSSVAESGPSHMSGSCGNVHGFGIGHSFANNAYCMDFWGWDVWDCGTGTYLPSGTTNAGERICYHGGAIFNNNFGVINDNTNSAFHFDNVSLDYNGVQAVAKAGRIFLSHCHMEAGTYASAPFVTYPVNGATIVIDGGWMQCTGANTSTIFESQATEAQGGGIFVSNVFMNSLGSGRWKSGPGRFSLVNPISYNISSNPTLSSLAENRLADGGFEMATVIEAFITADTAPITSRTAGSNINLTTSTAQARSGARSLRMLKSFGAGSPCSFVIAVPLARVGSLVNFLGYLKKPGADTGQVFISSGYAKIQNINGLDTLQKITSSGLDTVTFTAAPVDWRSTATGEPQTHAPGWATHFIVSVNADNFSGGSLYFDDFELYEN